MKDFGVEGVNKLSKSEIFRLANQFSLSQPAIRVDWGIPMLKLKLRSLAIAAAGAVTLLSAQWAMAADKFVSSATGENPAELQDNPAKYFLFHSTGLSADQVRGDLVYCIGLARPILSMRDRMPNTGGLIGALIEGRMAEIDRLRMRNAAMRKCMGLMGYDRYGIPQQEWKALVKQGDIVVDNDGLVDPEVVERMVAFAIGPAPTTGKASQ
ncbi:MAG: hypothetical protein ABJA20_11420 [Novosphingobium sp.]